MASTKTCKTCDEPATPETDYCRNCGAGINRWFHRRLAERLAYRDRLGVRTARMEVAISRSKESKSKK